MTAVTYVGPLDEVFVPAVSRVVAHGETVDVPDDVAGAAPTRPDGSDELADLARLVESLRINGKTDDHAKASAWLAELEREVAGAGLLAQVDNWQPAASGAAASTPAAALHATQTDPGDSGDPTGDPGPVKAAQPAKAEKE